MSDEDVKIRGVVDLARDLKQARARSGTGQGHAVFLVGAGCSISAGIPAAADVARKCALKLRELYEVDWGAPPARGDGGGPGDERGLNKRADEALEWLIGQGHVVGAEKDVVSDSYNWGALYPVFFEDHLKAPNVQRELISEIVAEANGRLSWTYACLGELVRLRIVHTVLTTNFDQLVMNGIVQAGIFPVIADGLHSFNRILGQPPTPQVVHLHGSMHTYNLRNSRKSVVETSGDQGTLAMIHTLLQQCNVLVVVGYAGGEEGLMEILVRASERLEQLVIYWVVYDNPQALSPNCTRLMKGENKFVVEGGESDRLLFDLMSALGAGPPQWIRDPIASLASRMDKLVSRKNSWVVDLMIEGHRRQIQCASASVRDRPDAEKAFDVAVAQYAEGDHASVLDTLKDATVNDGHDAVRLRGTAALDLAQNVDDFDLNQLRAAVGDFTALVEVSEGQGHTEDLKSLVNALQLISDQKNKKGNDDDKELKHIRELMEQYLPRLREFAADSDLATLTYSHAYASSLILIRKLSAKDDLLTEDKAELRRVASLFEEVIDLAERDEVSGKQMFEARDGLAQVLQLLASLGRSSQSQGEREEALRAAVSAVDQAQKVFNGASRSPDSEQDANISFNLATSIGLEWDLSDTARRAALRTRGMHAAMRAATAYHRLANTQRRDEMAELRTKFAEG